jgi:hypothetical protein
VFSSKNLALMKIGWLMSVTTGGSSLTKRLAFLPSKSAGGSWCPLCANTSGNAGAKSIMAAKNATIKNKTQNFLSLNSTHFSRIKIVAAYIVYFPLLAHAIATPNTINIDPLN